MADERNATITQTEFQELSRADMETVQGGAGIWFRIGDEVIVAGPGDAPKPKPQHGCFLGVTC